MEMEKRTGDSDIYFQELRRIIEEVSLPEVEKAADILFEAWKEGGTVFVAGCGGSASTASHFACDLAKATIVPGKKRFKTYSLVDNTPLISAWTNDEGWQSVFAQQLEPWLTEKDVLVGFSVHGGSESGGGPSWSENLTCAMKLAKERGAKVVGFAGFDGGAMKKMADVCIVVPADTEPLATPLVESFHVVLHHFICSIILRKKIAETE